jgi:hypothetical protein
MFLSYFREWFKDLSVTFSSLFDILISCFHSSRPTLLFYSDILLFVLSVEDHKVRCIMILLFCQLPWLLTLIVAPTKHVIRQTLRLMNVWNQIHFNWNVVKILDKRTCREIKNFTVVVDKTETSTPFHGLKQKQKNWDKGGSFHEIKWQKRVLSVTKCLADKFPLHLIKKYVFPWGCIHS